MPHAGVPIVVGVSGRIAKECNSLTLVLRNSRASTDDSYFCGVSIGYEKLSGVALPTYADAYGMLVLGT
jgi:hypothetical protein